MLLAAVLALAAVGLPWTVAGPQRRQSSPSTSDLSPNAQSLFDYSMSIQDARWDDAYKLIWYKDKGQWSTRFTAWYTAGLLKRNQGRDRENAKAALRTILMTQMTDNLTSEWYGTYKNSPDQPDPTPDSGLYPPKIYTTYDPNWREFIGSQLVQVVEEFEPVLGSDLVSDIEASLSIAAVGAMRRNGTEPDNLITGYSNPGLMRALVVGWIGHRTGNRTFIDFANEQGKLIADLFKQDGANTLGEYNSPTYYGMDAWALAANIKYGPPNATMTRESSYILTHLFADIADHYNPYLGNLAGPYDRAYTRDIATHSAVIDLFWWGLFGSNTGPIPLPGEGDLLFDAAQGAALALIMSSVSSHLAPATVTALSAPRPAANVTDPTSLFPPRLLHRSIHSTFDPSSPYYPVRNTSSWISAPLMIGAESLSEASASSLRGSQFVPAIVHWAADPSHTPYPYMGFFSLYPTSNVIRGVASANKLRVEYPDTTVTGTGSFQFVISGIPPSWTLQSSRTRTRPGSGTLNGDGRQHQQGLLSDPWNTLPCLSVNVTTSDGLKRLPTTYSTDTLQDHYYYNVTYVVGSGSGNGTGNGMGAGTGTATPRAPWVEFGVEYTC